MYGTAKMLAMPARLSCLSLSFIGVFFLASSTFGQDVKGPLFAESAASAPSLGTQVWKALREEGKRYASDSIALVRAPLSWKSEDLQKAAGIGLVLGGLMLADERLDEEVQEGRSGFTDRVSAATTRFGGQESLLIPAGLLFAGLAFQAPETRDMGREALEAALITHLLTKYVLKPGFGRERPEDSNGETIFHPFSHHSSFPSGHATDAFAVASVIANRSKGWLIPTVAYATATLVAFDRVNDRAHFPSDVFAGAVVGTATGRFLVKRHRRQEAEASSSVSVDIVPIPYGVRLQVLF